MRTVRGNDPFTAIQQLTSLSQHSQHNSLNHIMKQHQGGKNTSCNSLKIDRETPEIAETYLKPSWCGWWWHASIFFLLRSLSSPSHRHTSTRCSPAFHQVATILYFPPSNPCVYNSLFQPAPCRVSLPSNFLLSLVSRTFCFVRIHIQYLSIFTALTLH